MEEKIKAMTKKNSGSQPPQIKINTFSHILQEVGQAPATRRALYKAIESETKKQFNIDGKVVAFFTFFTFPVLIADQDADMLEEVLVNTSMDDKKLVLILNSPGGDALAAERIINICRTYSSQDFFVIVPKMAKSAATMICLGACKIAMSKTSELGPIDPQILIRDAEGRPTGYKPAHEIIESYKELLNQANKSKGRIEPYLQQLARYDARDIRSIKSDQALSESIAIKSLKSGMLSSLSDKQIKTKIKPFLDPAYTKSHGRPIYHNTAKECGLTVQLFDTTSNLWKSVWQLYMRLNYVVTNLGTTKIIESSEDSYLAQIPPDLQRLLQS